MTENTNRNAGRWALLRDASAFQFKLALDGLRDLVLSPLSIALALFGLLFGGDRPGRYFYHLLELGHRSDKWINLFGAAGPGDRSGASSDDLIDHVESMLKRKVSQKAKTRKESADGQE